MKTRRGWLVKRGKTFYATWEVSGKRFQKTTGEHDRRKAETRLAEIMRPFLVESEVRTLESVKARIEGAKGELAAIDEQRNPPLPLAKAWAAFLNSMNRPDSGDSTLRQYEAELSRFRKWLATAHAEIVAMRDVTPATATEYAQHLNAEKVSASTFNQHIGFLRLLWRTLRKEAKTAANPWEEIKRKRLVAPGRRELTIEELRRVCESAKGEMRALLAVGIYTGLRLGDAATLRWGEVDLVRGTIRRVTMKTARRKNTPVVIPIHATLRGILAEAPRGPRAEYVLPETAALYLRDSSALAKRIQAHFEANGIRTARPGTGFKMEDDPDGKPRQVHTGKRAAVEVGFHSLRHTLVSLCRQAGAPLSVVEALVGHESPAMTRHYTHVSEVAAGAAVASQPVVIGEAPLALPASDPLAALRGNVRTLADKLNGKNWRTVKTELAALA